MPDDLPSPSETAVLQFLWEQGTATVPEIHAHVCKSGPVGYTTVLKRIQRMEDKGLVRRSTGGGRAHIYKAAFKPQRTRKRLVTRLISLAFDDSPNALIQHAIGQHDLSKQDIADIRDLLDRVEKENPDRE